MSPVQRNPSASLHPHVSSSPGAAELTIREGEYMNHPTDFSIESVVDNDAESDDISKTIDYNPSLPPLPSSSPRPVLSVVYPSCLKQTVQERPNELSSTSTDFKEVVNYMFYLDRTPQFELTRGYTSSLLRAPSGYGKSTMVSMFKYHFNNLQRDEFEDNFRYTEAINDFGGLDVEAENFVMNDVINEGLRRFVDKYHFLDSIDKRWEELKATVAAKTFDNILDAIMDGKHTIVVLIDNYDSAYWAVDESAFNSQESYEKFKARFDSALSRFFDRPVASWTGLRQISYTFLAGEEQILSMVSEQLFHLTRDVIVQEVLMTDLFGCCEQDVVNIAGALN
ncbi:hypothetical protein PM082_011228 [Marasmius tenuissimus]|nr:hypothetical protein PM082_011228 [Marasmius tenuissimus]